MRRERPTPNDPPQSYAIEGEHAVFFRWVGAREYAAWRASGRLEPEPGGMECGKHLTTTAALARAWGMLMLSRGWERHPGHVLRIELGRAVAQEVDYVDANTDGVGACYFAAFEQLVGAQIVEVTS